jgi:hypothetical protein
MMTEVHHQFALTVTAQSIVVSTKSRATAKETETARSEPVIYFYFLLEEVSQRKEREREIAQ